LARVWERQTGEKALWFRRFEQYYLPLSPSGAHGRTINGAYVLWGDAEGGKKRPKRAPPAWYKAAERWNWRERAEAYDAHLHRLALVDQERERIRMIQEHADMWRVLRDRAFRIMAEWPLEDEVDAKGNVVKAGLRSVLEGTPGELRRWLLDGIRGEREARGLSGAVLELALSVQDAPTEDLVARLRELAVEIDAEE